MSFWEYLTMTVITLIGIKYLIDMVRFAMGYEINGKKREPVFTFNIDSDNSVQMKTVSNFLGKI